MNGIDTEGSGRRDGTANTIDLTAVAGSVEISGLAALVRILHPEVANDLLTVNGLFDRSLAPVCTL
jgi:hypothetical protein